MKISGKTTVYGVIGDPIEHTLSPLMHASAIEKMGIDAVYVPFHVRPDELEHAIKGIKALGVGGLNVTVPHKTRVMDYLDNLTDEAKAVGAVNTVINHDGVLTGDNTDVYGFTRCLFVDGGLERFPKRVYVIGAGGAARGVVYACAKSDEVSEVVVINRTLSKAEKLAEELSAVTGSHISAMPAIEETFSGMLSDAELLINTTSVGMYPQVEHSPVPYPEVFHEGQVVCDIIYNPSETRLLRDAASHGAKVVGGLAMLAYQGARSLSLWTGMEAPAEVMLDVLKQEFGQ
ncbi:MAG: shikimate dehydrogenase [Candidatus Latescibacteria bacterium]|nr:shikimate dehydrogenase [Candidatus Latescibacterota bacterium]